MNNLSAYLQYPILSDSKTITFAKTDSFYQYNTFWALKKMTRYHYSKHPVNPTIDKVVNQDNMNYGDLSFKESQLRAKNVKVRHILTTLYYTYCESVYCSTSTNII